MTISSATRKAGPYSGNASTTAFPFSFKVFAAADVLVIKNDGTIETTLVLTTDYTVALNADQNANPGGTVTYPASGSPLPVGQTITVSSSIPETQGTSITNQGGFYPKIIEDALDRLTILVQQLRDLGNRTLKLPISYGGSASTTLPLPSANLGLKWNSTGTAIVNTATDPDAYAVAAAASASVASTSASNAASSATAASTSATNAANSASAAAASVASAGLPASLAGKALYMLRVLAGETGYELRTPAQVRSDISAAASGANSDITSLSGITTALSIAQGGTGATSASGAVSNLGVTSLTTRQAILSGPVDSSGFSAFGGSTGSTTVTASGTLIATSANGFDSNGQVNRVGSITNPSWTGLSTNGTMYLYLDIAADKTCTTGSTTLAPNYQWGGTYSTTSGQFTFNVQEMTGKVGNGTTATQTYRVFIGEVTVSGGVVSAITWYALQGRYDSGWTATLPSSGVFTSKNHCIGIAPDVKKLHYKCLTAEQGYSVGDVIDGAVQAGTVAHIPSLPATSLTVGFSQGSNGSCAEQKTSGTWINLTAASWAYRITANRGW